MGQPEFNFESECGQDGFAKWHEQRRDAIRQLARKMGLPLERRVEVWLRGDIRLVGVLRLSEQRLFIPDEADFALELTVDNVPFTPGEMLSCVAMDTD